MTDEQVQIIVEKLSIQYFNRAFVHRAYFNSRLKTTGGRYLLSSHDIELNKKLYDHFGMEELRGIILHELCHYHLHLLGKGYKHQDQDFKQLLNEVGAPRFCSRINEGKKTTTAAIHLYHCIKCKQLYRRKRKMDIKKYCCSVCGGSIELVPK